jgi:hypothetical protein
VKKLIAAIAFFLACAQRPGTPETFEAEKIFTTPEGCNVYRFYDAGKYAYVSACARKK